MRYQSPFLHQVKVKIHHQLSQKYNVFKMKKNAKKFPATLSADLLQMALSTGMNEMIWKRASFVYKVILGNLVAENAVSCHKAP